MEIVITGVLLHVKVRFILRIAMHAQKFNESMDVPLPWVLIHSMKSRRHPMTDERIRAEHIKYFRTEAQG